ncbi:MAG TPA: alpha-galactosidase [Phycisphaerae bacterium]|nr:alpha-galactosidase [Phycisphaerae bacterium]HRY67590.1 alpha-galactosidase [Phycisphaerae bacterium]HSA24977.1 alpha-galactosidase [Phycisphaerae bacterium]
MNRGNPVSWLVWASLFLSGGGVLAAEDDLPASEVEDAVMAAAEEVKAMSGWVAGVFLGQPAPVSPRVIPIEVRRQDHSFLHFGQSCMETPLRIGGRDFAHGLGTHAHSEIVVTVPKGAKRFKAYVGIDHNFDTRGVNGSVQLSVEIGGREVVRTATLRGGDAAVPIDVDLPEGMDKLVLKADATADGPAYDQCDWADAQLVMDDGSVRWLDEGYGAEPFMGPRVPFSFVYGGKESKVLMGRWKRTAETAEGDDRLVHRVRWADPETGLEVTAVVSVFRRYPAVDWVLHFENKGGGDTPMIERIQALDLELATGNNRQAVVLNQINGDTCSAVAFQPVATPLDIGRNVRLAPTGGRPASISAFPFLDVQYGGQGLITAIGWTGQWAASLERGQGGRTVLRAGMEQTHLVLHPGERIRSPRILLLAWTGDRRAAHNRFRRLLLFHYIPKHGGRPVRMPIAMQTFDRYWKRPGWATEAGQLEYVQVAEQLGVDSVWLDAAWFPGDFPNGVGNWFAKPEAFPRGLKPVSDACHAKGMRFILWFEPERVGANTAIAREHPEFVFGGKEGGLFKLNDPEARRFLTDLLARRIEEYGLDVYRNDFNIDPLSFWRANDGPDRQGMTEIRYVEGLYAMWDELLARRPGLVIDNCASGGRRIDLEMCSRSVPLWRSDTGCSAGHPEWNQSQCQGIGEYVPLHALGCWSPEAYECRSAVTAGAICEWGYLDEGFPTVTAKAAVAESRANQRYWYGDFYPLTPVSLAADAFVAHQYHRPDLDAGLVLAFRRSECGYLGIIVGLAGVKPDVSYRVEFMDEARTSTSRTMSGRELQAGLDLRIPVRGHSLVVRYAPAGG